MNRSMGLDDFKFIYWCVMLHLSKPAAQLRLRHQAGITRPSRQLACRRMEYTHRMWGRVLGLVFALPAAYFVARGAVPRPLGARLGLLLLMGGTQGAVGWWMVKSGLEVGLTAMTYGCDRTTRSVTLFGPE